MRVMRRVRVMGSMGIVRLMPSQFHWSIFFLAKHLSGMFKHQQIAFLVIIRQELGAGACLYSFCSYEQRSHKECRCNKRPNPFFHRLFSIVKYIPHYIPLVKQLLALQGLWYACCVFPQKRQKIRRNLHGIHTYCTLQYRLSSTKRWIYARTAIS